MSQINYKAKYEDLKGRFLNTTDLAWRLGYEQGLKDARLEQSQQQEMQNNAIQQAAATPNNPEQSNEQNQPESEEAAPSPSPHEDELGQHIEKLESMLGKSELSSSDMQDLKKTLNDIRSLQVSINLTKSMENIKNAKMAKHSFKMTPKLKANLSEGPKAALSMQEKIVNDIMTKWERDSIKASSDINSILKIDGLVKKE